MRFFAIAIVLSLLVLAPKGLAQQTQQVRPQPGPDFPYSNDLPPGIRLGAASSWSSDRQPITLGFCIDKYPQKPSRDDVTLQIEAALFEWSHYVHVRFIQIRCGGERTLTFSWERGDHGDGTPFLPNVRGHTFYPPPVHQEPLAGDMHFNSDFDWSEPLVIYLTALHEIGHALGLADSYTSGTLMYEYFFGISLLQKEDVWRVRQLYMPRCYRIECAMRNIP